MYNIIIVKEFMQEKKCNNHLFNFLVLYLPQNIL